MRILPVFALVILAGCSRKPETSSSSNSMKMSSAQVYLNNLKDSLEMQYSAARTIAEKQAILDTCFRKLKAFLWKTPMDSLKVKIDEITVDGPAVIAKSHIKGIEFSGKITFNGKLTPRLDSIYKFMKSLRPGSSILLNMAFDGDFQINRPDSPADFIFKIGAYPIPIQYKAQ